VIVGRCEVGFEVRLGWLCWPALARFGGLHFGEHCGGAVMQPYSNHSSAFSFEVLIGEVLSWDIFDFV
jgi:hypothetical protein